MELCARTDCWHWYWWQMWNTTLIYINKKKHYYGFYLLDSKIRVDTVNWFLRPCGSSILFCEKLDPTELGSAISSHIGQCTIGSQWNWSWLSWVIEFVVVVVQCRFFSSILTFSIFPTNERLFCIDFSRTEKPFDFNSFYCAVTSKCYFNCLDSGLSSDPLVGARCACINGKIGYRFRCHCVRCWVIDRHAHLIVDQQVICLM